MKYFNLLAAILLLSACAKESTEMTITADVKGANEVIVYLAEPSKIEAIDTVKIIDGHFKIGKEIDSADFYTLVFPATQNTVPLYIEPGEKLVLNIDASTSNPNYTVTGSEGSNKMKAQWDSYVKTYALIDSLDAVTRQYQQDSLALPKSIRVKLQRTYMARIEQHRNEIKAIIDQDTTHVTNVMAINQTIGQNRLFDIALDPTYYRKINNGLMLAHPENKSTIAFNNQYEQALLSMEMNNKLKEAQSKTKVGELAPNIAMQDPEGMMRQLSDLNGKVVLLDFWASWCRPCRVNNPELVALYKKYNTQGFEIFSVSLDGESRQSNAKQDWLNAIKSDKLTWPNHVSDLLGWQSSSQKVYGFTGIPHTVLINKQGFIVAKNLHGEALEAKIKEQL